MLLRHNPGFLVIEGLDGAGTTTQAAAVADALRGADLQVLCTAEPSEGPIGLLLRTYVRREMELDPSSATLLFTADRSDHLARAIRPALEAGRTVVCDRYLLSTLAYQGWEGVDRSWILTMSAHMDVPDLTVFCDLPEDDRRARVDGRGPRERFEDPEAGPSLRDSYLTSIELLRQAGHHIEVVDASGTPQEVTARIMSLVDGWKPRPGPS